MKRIISILLTGLMVVGMFGCSKKPEVITDIPATPEEAMTDANLVFYYYSAGFYKKDEWIKVTSDNMPDNGQEAFSAIHKILANA